MLGGDGPYPRKPDPTGLLSLMNQAGIDAPACLMVGDSAADLRVARNAGTGLHLPVTASAAGIPPGELLETDRIIPTIPLQLAAAL